MKRQLPLLEIGFVVAGAVFAAGLSVGIVVGGELATIIAVVFFAIMALAGAAATAFMVLDDPERAADRHPRPFDAVAGVRPAGPEGSATGFGDISRQGSP